MKLIDNLYCYLWQGRENNGHSYLFANVLRGDRPHVLIDPGHLGTELGERCAERLIHSMATDRIKGQDIGLIINTHCHPDHCEANQFFVDQSKAKQGTSKAKQALIALHQDEDQHRRSRTAEVLQARSRANFEPDFYLQEGELILGKENKLTLKILHTPGHSPGSICIYWPKNKVLISGDVIFFGSIGRTDIAGGNSLLLKRSIERLSQLDIHYLLPGHNTQYGNIISGKDNVVQNFAFIRMNYFPML